MKEPHAGVQRVETYTGVDSSREGRKCTREAERLLDDSWENVRATSSHHRKRRSPNRYNGYMALMGECFVREPSSFQEAVKQLAWVDAMVQVYDSIVRNIVWDVVSRLKDKSVVSSHWL